MVRFRWLNPCDRWVIWMGVVGFGVGCQSESPAPVRSVKPVVERSESRRLEIVSLLDRNLYAPPPDAELRELEANLASARTELAANPDDVSKIIRVGRRLGYLWRMREAVQVFTEGIKRHPDVPALYRHRGHRQISLRRFEEAEGDLEKAAKLIEGRPLEVEPDGKPNARDIPLTTTQFNIWYHLGLVRYFMGKYVAALAAFEEAASIGSRYDDNVVATSDWMYMTLRRLGRHEQAAGLLDFITEDMDIIENTAYHRRLLMYKGVIAPEDLLDAESASSLELATLGYGLGNWYWCNGEREKAVGVFERIVAGPYWPAFGFIAAEADVARIRRQGG